MEDFGDHIIDIFKAIIARLMSEMVIRSLGYVPKLNISPSLIFSSIAIGLLVSLPMGGVVYTTLETGPMHLNIWQGALLLLFWTILGVVIWNFALRLPHILNDMQR